MRLSGTLARSISTSRGLGNLLWDLAGSRPSIDQRFAESKSLVDAATGTNIVIFTRAGSGTYVGSDGLIKTATTNEPRFHHDPTTGESLGLLVEEQRTNLLLRSEQFNSANWLASGILPFGSGSISDATIAPDGYTTADLITENTDTGFHDTRQFGSFVSGLTYTWSVFFKAYNGTRNLQIILSTAAFPGNPVVTVDPATGQIINSSDINARSQAYSNGWYRVSFSATADATAENFTYFRLVNGTSDSYTGDGTSGIYLWGTQLEVGFFSTSYIPTTTSAVTRAADVLVDTTRGAAIRSLYAEFRSPASGTGPIVSIDDDTANERIELFTSSADPRLLITDGGNAQADIDAGSIAANTTTRLAARFNTNNFAASVSGGAEVVDTTGTMPTVNRIRIGRNQAGNCLNGTIARITGWDSPLPALSTITW